MGKQSEEDGAAGWNSQAGGQWAQIVGHAHQLATSFNPHRCHGWAAPKQTAPGIYHHTAAHHSPLAILGGVKVLAVQHLLALIFHDAVIIIIMIFMMMMNSSWCYMASLRAYTDHVIPDWLESQGQEDDKKCLRSRLSEKVAANRSVIKVSRACVCMCFRKLLVSPVPMLITGE